MKRILPVVISLLTVFSLFAQPYPDQHYVIRGGDIYAQFETNDGLQLSDDGNSVMLQDGVTLGYAILAPQTCQYPFDQGLPSWNGTAIDQDNGFVVQMRFPYGNGWSSWLTVGYWKDFIWGAYGLTGYGGGKIEYDYAILYDHQDRFQFKIVMSRTSAQAPSPTIHKLSFFA
ncbi:hypothetical protein JXO59_07680, partial [candidate division KSB1 bacterium]|nr:hypothetical protein [candidate division KSB1 bacterium]